MYSCVVQCGLYITNVLSCYCLNIAQQIIDEWLKEDTEVVKYGDVNAPSTVLAQNRVKTTRSRNKRLKTCDLDDLLVSHTNWNGDLENTDYITGMDFVDTDISDCVQQVMAGMYTQPLECDVVKMIESQQATSNPAITMEMRHKQVKYIDTDFYCDFCYFILTHYMFTKYQICYQQYDIHNVQTDKKFTVYHVMCVLCVCVRACVCVCVCVCAHACVCVLWTFSAMTSKIKMAAI